MSGRRQYTTSPGVCDAQHLTSSNFNPDSPNSQPPNDGHSISRDTASEGPKRYEDLQFRTICYAAAELQYMQNVGCGFEGATFRGNLKGHHSTRVKVSRAGYQSTNREAGTSQQADSYGIINLSETFQETEISVQSRADVEMLVKYTKLSPETPPLLPSGAQLQAVATRVTEAPQVGTGNALETLGSGKLSKRRWEQTLSLSARDNDIGSSDDGSQGTKKVKVDCDCEADHSWWMTIKIGDLNEVLQRIDAAVGLVRRLAHQSDDLDEIAVGNLVDLLKDSQGILVSAQDDMRAEGGRDREAL